MRDQLKIDLARDEGLRLKPYKCPANKTTIGYGRNLEDVGITQGEAALLLDNDITRVEAYLDKYITWWRGRPDHVQRGMANMCFQLGIGTLLKFQKMLSALHAGDYETARREGLDSAWAKQTPERAARVVALFAEKEP